MSSEFAWFIVLLAAAIVLLLAELVVPSHGVLTVLAMIALLFTVGVSFSISKWFGLATLVAVAILGPIVGSMMLRLWQRSPLGRRIVLQTVVENPPRPVLLVGSVGTAMNELRPMGECEFGDIRVRARSEMGDVIPVGAKVSVIEFSGGVATVRPAAAL